MTKAYRRPLLVFYLSQPPRRGDRGQDFRTLPGKDPYNADLDALIRDIKGRQGLIRSILEDEEAEGPGFVGTATMEMPAAEVARRISANLGFSLGAFRGEKTGDDAFAYRSSGRQRSKGLRKAARAIMLSGGSAWAMLSSGWCAGHWMKGPPLIRKRAVCWASSPRM
jgi:hypothetical protein